MNQISDLSSFNSSLFNSSSLGRYYIKPDSTPPYNLSLFHGIYYSLYEGFDPLLKGHSAMDDTLKEYMNINSTLSDVVDKRFYFKEGPDKCLLQSVVNSSNSTASINTPITLDFELTFLDQQINIRSFKSTILLN